MMTDPIFHTLSAEEATALLTEALRRELARILLEQDHGPARSDDEINARIDLLEQESLTLKRRARRGDFTKVAGTGAPRAISYKEVERAVEASAPDDPLYIRVTKPKLRMPWTEERLARFLTCPIYTGCSSEHRRWKPGQVIVRDAIYWVPLIILTIGTRIEEILLLKRNSLRLRNQVHCLALGFTSEARGKTEDAERIVPIPQLLIDLGFIDWIKSLDDAHGPLLFPEIARRTTTGKVTEAFGKALTRTLGHLELADFDEDIYAARKTLSSMLRRAEVMDGQRQGPRRTPVRIDSEPSLHGAPHQGSQGRGRQGRVRA